MNRKIGFIGCGNMAKAMIGGMVKSAFSHTDHIYASNRSRNNLEEMEQAYGIQTTDDNLVIAKECRTVFLAVKPEMYSPVIQQIKDAIHEDAIIIMIAAGQTIEQNEKRFERKIKLVRAMPNTPVLVGEGMTGISYNDRLTEEEAEEVKSLFECFGQAEFVDEKLMDVVSGVSGSSPAYAYMFIEALADGAVLQGMPRKQAYVLASQALLGAAKMVLETGIHPGQLKDNVCSPGGSTIKGVASLEENGLRTAVITAVNASITKAKSLSE